VKLMRNVSRSIVLCLFALSSTVVVAKEIVLDFKGRLLNADLQFVTNKTLKDGVILITHGGLAHRDQETIAHMSSLLNERGYNTLAINLSLGICNRHGMYDCEQAHRHTNDEVMDELASWFEWLSKQGATDIVVLGHSRGGAQVARFAARHLPHKAHAVVLMAPSTAMNAGKGYVTRYQKPLDPLLARAKALQEQGKGETLIHNTNMMHCRDTTVSANSIVSNYGEDDLLDAPTMLKEIKEPTLIVIAGDDEVVIDLGKELVELQKRPNIKVEVVDGSGHFFRDLNGEDAADMVDAFLSTL